MCDKLTPIVRGLRDAVEQALATYSSPVARVGLVAGSSPAWDECCSGMLYLNTSRIYPTGPFPNKARVTNCPPDVYAAFIGVGVLRCVPSMDDSMTPPSAAALDEAAEQVHKDAAVLALALTDALLSEGRVINFSLDEWVPLNPDGTCGGGEWTVALSYSPCNCVGG